MKTINLDEILKTQVATELITEMQKYYILEAMKLACKQTIELCAENAKVCVGGNGIEKMYLCELEDNTTVKISVSEQSILNTINQIV